MGLPMIEQITAPVFPFSWHEVADDMYLSSSLPSEVWVSWDFHQEYPKFRGVTDKEQSLHYSSTKTILQNVTPASQILKAMFNSLTGMLLSKFSVGYLLE